MDDSDDDDGEVGPSPGSTAASGDSPQASDSAVKKRKKKQAWSYNPTQWGSSPEGSATFQAVGSKDSDHNALLRFKSKLSWGQSFALFTLVMCGKDNPIQKATDMETCTEIMYSEQP